MSKTITWEHDGLSFDVRVSGPQAGEPLLLHGFPQDSTCWDALGENLVAAGYRTIAPDQRGYSPGARPRNVGSYSLDNLTGDVIALADDFELEGFHLVGHDWGGVVVWELAARRPERVSSLTSLSMPHPAASTPIEVPTLYVWGTADGALGGRAARATEQHVNGPYRFEMLWDASHWLPEDEADKVAELLLDHLEAFAESSSQGRSCLASSCSWFRGPARGQDRGGSWRS